MKIFQPIVTGSFTVSGSVFLPSLVTSSTAVTNVVMYGTNGQLFTTASSAIGGGGSGTPQGNNTEIQYNNNGSFGGVNKLKFDGTNLVGTGSFTGSFTGQFNGSITTAETASFATNFTIASTLTLDETLTDFAKVNSTIVGSNNLLQQATGSYRSAHCKYTLNKTTNARAGEFVTVWNGTTVTYYDNATTDIGSTTDIVLTSAIVSNQLQVNAIAASTAWSIKMIVTYI
jgi:transposase-like protein